LEKGQRLITNCTKTTFFISDVDDVEWGKYAEDQPSWLLKEHLTHSLDGLVFV
jgi:hypothetical protein